jgi:hypothetical protein
VHDSNPDWGEGYLGFCRPSWQFPIYYPSLELVNLSEKDLLLQQNRHHVAFIREYEIMRAGKKDEIWLDLEEMQEVHKDYIGNQATDRITKRRFTSEDQDEPSGSGGRPVRKRKKTVLEWASQSDDEAQDFQDLVVTPDRKTKQERPRSRKMKPKSLKKGSQAFSSPKPEPRPKSPTKDSESSSRSVIAPIFPQKTKSQAGGLTPWKQMNWRGRIPQTQNDRAFSYVPLVKACKRYRKCKTRTLDPEESPEASGDDDIFNYRTRQTLEEYEPNESQLKTVDKGLLRYKTDPRVPQFSNEIPVNYADFPEGNLRPQPQMPVSDADGKFPGELSKVEILQREIIRLDALNRGLMMVHANDRLVLPSLKAYIKQEGQLTEAQKGSRKEDGLAMIDALCKNVVSRENLIADSESIVLAVRRRDSAFRRKLDEPGIAEAVTAPMLQSQDKREATHIIQEKQAEKESDFKSGEKGEAPEKETVDLT